MPRLNFVHMRQNLSLLYISGHCLEVHWNKCEYADTLPDAWVFVNWVLQLSVVSCELWVVRKSGSYRKFGRLDGKGGVIVWITDYASYTDDADFGRLFIDGFRLRSCGLFFHLPDYRCHHDFLPWYDPRSLETSLAFLFSCNTASQASITCCLALSSWVVW